MATSLYSIWARKRYAEEQRKNAEEIESNNMMKLKEWLEAKKNAEPTIFVDQDNTLLLLSSMENLSRMGHWANNNSTFTNIMGHNLGILPRPHAKAFLSECRRMATVYILTAGTSQFQEQVLKAVGLLDVVNGVYGRDTYYEVPKGKNSILIDNLPHTHPNSVAKMEAMGGGMFLKVSDWNGDKPKDNELMEALPKLRKLYQTLNV